MQEAFGGTFMLKLFMVFFIIYVFFIGIALNFAKIYRVKNNVINILEQYQYAPGPGSSTRDEVYNKVANYLASVPYEYKFIENDRNCKNGDSTLKDLGVCVIQKGENGKFYYSVSTFYRIDFPFFTNLGLDWDPFSVSASGETIVIDTE